MSILFSSSKLRWIIGIPLLILAIIGVGLISFAFMSEGKSSTSQSLTRSQSINQSIEELASKSDYKVHLSSVFSNAKKGVEKRIVFSRSSLGSERLLAVCERLHRDMAPEPNAIIEIFSNQRSAEKWKNSKIALYSRYLIINHIHEALNDWDHIGTYIKSETPYPTETCEMTKRGLFHDAHTTVNLSL